MNYEESLKKLKLNLDQAKNMKNKAEGTLEELKNQESLILAELKDLGVDPENLENEIEKLKGEIESLLKEANDMLPMDLLENVNKNEPKWTN